MKENIISNKRGIGMLKSSLGFHTITLSCLLLYHDGLLNDFYNYSKQTGSLKIYKNEQDNLIIKFYPEYKGIEWEIRYNDWLYDKTGIYAKLLVTINPKILGKIQDYITAATFNDMENAIANFNAISQSISPQLDTFDKYSVSRIDYCINFSLSELCQKCSPEQLMYLIKKSNIPSSYQEWMQYDKVSHRMKSSPNSFYLMNNSVHINCYNKYLQLVEKSEENIQKSRSLTRKRSFPLTFSSVRTLTQSSSRVRTRAVKQFR